MSDPHNDLPRRRPVWEALSDLFLDTELNEARLRWIARRLAESGCSDKELHGILFHEVYPVCIQNMHDVTGVWAGFRLDWLEKAILRRAPGPLPDDIPLPADYRMIEPEWRRVLQMLAEERRKVGETKE